MEESGKTGSDDSGFEETGETQPRPALDTQTNSKLPPLPAEDIQKLPSLTAQPLTGYGYSLLPDMLFGWQPKLVHGGPIPLIFNKAELPVTRNCLTAEDNPIVYHGFRPKDSLVMHRAFSSLDTYPVPNYPTMQVYEYLHRRDQILKDPRPFVGMNPDCDPTDLEFDSTFESGNLDLAVKAKDMEYDLYMRTDANTRGHRQWYYFSATPQVPGEVRFNILNFTKNESLYSQGMMPCVYDEGEPELGWHRAGMNIRYKTSKINPFTRRCYYCLTFSYVFKNIGKKVFFAYAIPYTYTRLRKLLVEVSSGKEMIVKREELGKSLSGVEVPLVTITNFGIQVSRKQSVVVTGRVHPGETYGSYMMEGFIRFLVSDDPTAHFLRDRLVFHIIPMLNPDGVIMGNYRTGFAGCDLNRQFQRPNFVLHPTVTALKTLITRVWKEHDIIAFLDLHAHSKQKGVFMYGPHYPLHNEKYYKMRVLPKLICGKSQVFRYASCKFRNERSKRKAARLVIWKEFKLANSYTVEASFYGFLTAERTTMSFNEELMLDAGKGIAEGIHDYVRLQDAELLEKDKRRFKRKSRKNKPFPDPSTRLENPQDSTLDEPTLDKPPESETIDDVMEEIKEEHPDNEPGEAEESDSSDGDESDDDLEPADQKELHKKIVEVMEEFSELTTNQKTIRSKGKNKGKKGEKNVGEVEARSHLEQYFSKAGQYDRKKQRPKTKGRAVVPKIYDPSQLSNAGPGYRSVSLKAKDVLLRQPTQKELSRKSAHRCYPDTAQSTPAKLPAELSTRLSAWLRRRLPQTARRGSRDSEDLEDHSVISDCKPLSPIPPIRPIRFGSVHEHRPRKAPPRPQLVRQLSTNLNQAEG